MEWGIRKIGRTAFQFVDGNAEKESRTCPYGTDLEVDFGRSAQSGRCSDLPHVYNAI